MFKKLHLVHNLRAGVYLEVLLASAAATVVVVRAFLEITGYPQLGNNQTLHIAHMLWGGLIMIEVILFFLSFFGRHIHMISAVVGGIGFGVFIDELGKFITVNNDYFFQPAIPLMYFVFVLLFLLGRYFLRMRQPTSKDYLVNSMAMIQDSFINEYKDPEYYEKIEYMLKKAGRKNKYVTELRNLVQLRVSSIGINTNNHRLRSALDAWYQRLLKKKIIIIAVVIFFILYTTYNVFDVLQPLIGSTSFSDLSRFEQLELSSVVIIAMITLSGMFEFIFSRVNAYRTMELAVYLSLYLLQIFIFYDNQLRGIFGLLISLITLFILKYLIKLERRYKHKHILGRNNVNPNLA